MVEKELIDIHKAEAEKEAAEQAQKLAAEQNPVPSRVEAPATVPVVPATALNIANGVNIPASAGATAATTLLAANMAEAYAAQNK